MSVDALTFTVVKGAENVNGKLLERYAIVLFSSGYPSGGYTFPRALNTQYGQLGIADLIGVEVIASSTNSILYTAVWDGIAGKLAVLLSGVEVGNNVDIHTIGLFLRLTGTR